ncbi:metallophosphoesterase [Phragmitibacter flavus]|uniref:Metallophosphoesterase n=1 Tax=Phragmitibacter flavus TaxID=2576071 RepID=A0A5R8KFS0_9BACT|nr:metallophosphoesterase [Phragmitibacter flavus]TLD71081.1 metallophosphoesterase [Phragmitibacter flavus]
MKHRTFLKTLAATATSWLTSRHGLFSQETPKLVQPPFAPVVPQTPFDAPAGTWTLAVLPDTQYYSQNFPDVFVRQTEWIAAHKTSHQILFVAHEGDITNHNTPEQWTRAQKAMRVLNTAAVPYALVPGNHDLGDNGKANDRSTLMNDYFSPADYQHSPGHILFEPGKMENSAHPFQTPTGKQLLLALEFGPRDEVINWANTIATQHADHQITIVTHAHLYSDNLRNDWTIDGVEGNKKRGNPKVYGLNTNSTVNDGEQVWQKLASKHANIRFILNGHITSDLGTGLLTSTATTGQTVHQILANYQDNSPNKGGTVMPAKGHGGGGFMRLMQFHPDGKTVQMKTYSPWYDQWLTEPNQQFSCLL